MNSRKISWYHHLFIFIQTYWNECASTNFRRTVLAKSILSLQGKIWCQCWVFLLYLWRWCRCPFLHGNLFCKTFVFYTILARLRETKPSSVKFKCMWWLDDCWEIILILASLESICWRCFSWKRCRHRKARALRRCTHAGASSGGAVGIPLDERKKKLAGQQGLRKKFHRKCVFRTKWM